MHTGIYLDSREVHWVFSSMAPQLIVWIKGPSLNRRFAVSMRLTSQCALSMHLSSLPSVVSTTRDPASQIRPSALKTPIKNRNQY